MRDSFTLSLKRPDHEVHVIRSQTPNPAQSPLRVIEHETGREVGWVNRYLDREYVRRLADTTLRSCAYALLHFVRCGESSSYGRRARS